MDRQMDGQMERGTGSQTDGWTDRPMERQVDRIEFIGSSS